MDRGRSGEQVGLFPRIDLPGGTAVLFRGHRALVPRAIVQEALRSPTEEGMVGAQGLELWRRIWPLKPNFCPDRTSGGQQPSPISVVPIPALRKPDGLGRALARLANA